ncbi:MAG: radical SAM family heme chaperone HemW [Clostridiales bacterium]|nr:radical SAM family heme chaperone HemW [Clostridiales bacterium]
MIRKLGLYLHIPFCKSRCIYCDFVSSLGDCKSMDKYVDYLCNQIKADGEKYSGKYVVDTVYFGGGTPTLLSGENFQRLANTIKDTFELNIKEFSVEANPCTVDREKLQALKDVGVTRISVGVQSFNDKLLKMLGRRHDSEMAKRAIKLALEMGFDVSVDCMLGLPNQTLADIKNFIETADNLGVEHISAYTLSVEEGTPLERLIEQKILQEKSDDEVAIFYEYTCKLLKERGYTRYEVSNFCKRGKYSFHNLRYWRGEDYLGLGLSAHSLIDGERWRITDNFDEYYSSIDKGLDLRLDKEELSVDEKKSEMIMLSLRLDEGLDIEKYESSFGGSFADEYAFALDKNKNYVDFDGKRLRIKDEYVEVMNSIVVDFIK